MRLTFTLRTNMASTLLVYSELATYPQYGLKIAPRKPTFQTASFLEPNSTKTTAKVVVHRSPNEHVETSTNSCRKAAKLLIKITVDADCRHTSDMHQVHRQKWLCINACWLI